MLPPALTAEAPDRPLPLIVTGTLVPRTPLTGEIELSVGPWTLNVTAPLVPPRVVTVTFLLPVTVAGPMVKVAVTCVSLTATTLLTLMLAAPGFTDVVVASAVPVRVTFTVAPRRPELGDIELSVGAGGVVTVKVTTLLLPTAVVRVTFFTPSTVPGAITNVAVTVVSFTTVRFRISMLAAVMLRAIVPVK